MQTKVDASKLELTEEIVDIRRVAKTVKGGRNMRFSVTVVVGDGEGHVGMGLGKAIEIPEAVRKATEDAKKKMIYVPTVGTTVPHETVGEFGAGKVLIMPSAKGTGVIAGGAARAVIELAGIRDIRTKSLRSNNPKNVVCATIDGLASLRNVEAVAKVRGISEKQVFRGKEEADA